MEDVITYRGISLMGRTTILPDYNGYDITIYCTQVIGSDGSLHNYDIIELWDSVTGEPIAEGLHFDTVADAIAWINI